MYEEVFFIALYFLWAYIAYYNQTTNKVSSSKTDRNAENAGINGKWQSGLSLNINLRNIRVRVKFC